MLLDFLTFSLFFLFVSLFSTIVDVIYQHVADITTLYWKVVFVFCFFTNFSTPPLQSQVSPTLL